MHCTAPDRRWCFHCTQQVHFYPSICPWGHQGLTALDPPPDKYLSLDPTQFSAAESCSQRGFPAQIPVLRGRAPPPSGLAQKTEVAARSPTQRRCQSSSRTRETHLASDTQRSAVLPNFGWIQGAGGGGGPGPDWGLTLRGPCQL